jgi:phytoene dehydrogenase-like protein
MSKNIIIIGAGLAGLTAGVYAKLSGFEVTILEQHSIPGGMSTSWRRKGYLFEGGIHWMTGSSPDYSINKLWREVGALDDSVKIRYDDPFRIVEYEGKKLYMYRDIDKLEKHMNEIAPEDKAAIKRFASDVRALAKVAIPIMDIKGVKTAEPQKMSLGDLFKMLPALMKMGKLGKMSISDYIDQFKNPALRFLLEIMLPDMRYNALSLLITIGTLAAGDGGYPEGGSLALTKRMADKFTGLGGEIIYNTKAEKVTEQNGNVSGVIVDGKLMSADAVIITQETIAAAEQLFETPPKDEWLAEMKRTTKPAVCTFVCIGVKTILKETPIFKTSQPITCGGFTFDFIGFNNYHDYPGYAPEGCTALSAFLDGDSYDFWKQAKLDGRYEAEKKAVADQIIRELTKKYPETEGKIEVIDVATPLTYERDTGASHGSWMSVLGKNEMSAKSYPATLEGIKGLYFAGQRIMKPGGMPAALMTGRSAAQMICKQFDFVFKNK